MVDKETIRRGYDELAESYAAAQSEDGSETGILAPFLDRLTTPARILDAGCGQGTPVLQAAPDDVDAVGVDFSREQLNLATENAPDAAFIQGDMTRLPIRENECDAVTALHSLIHVPLEDHQAVIDEFARVLCPGGRLLLSEGTTEWQGSNPSWLDSGVEMQWHIAGAETTHEQLRNAGFTITDEWGRSNEFADNEERWVFFVGRLEGDDEGQSESKSKSE
ncbi:methyltransferase domain-containing protein [Natronorubrum sp. JWXQ-INN-674]|uniref:Methyltransferase domain-containing protein n=1 Tax=Natronorubrum halalkaliphilum TaxID=2691917 RepID=A0A6B0VPK8_9EURY|nr:class I SAM-dependent methyltransferase [Natronorubrum halalkaliphilum]MXV63067.1 methyltransferase domain-containing protein [Natronorubrum halalkaliphilum]